MNDRHTSVPCRDAPSARRQIVVCILLFLLACILRTAWLRYEGVPSQEGLDSVEYIALARNLAGGLGFTSDGVGPSTYRPPLFSCLLAAWCYVLGSLSLGVMVMFEIVVQSLCAPLTYLLALRSQPTRWFAVFGGLLIAVNPFFVLGIGFLLQEPTQMLVATAMGISVVEWCRRPGPGRAAMAGFFFGLGALAKSPFLIAPVIVVLVYCLGPDFRRQLGIRQVILAGCVAACVVVPWTVRNYRVSGGRIIPVNSQDMAFAMWLMADGNFVPRGALSDPPHEVQKPQKGILLTYGNPEGFDLLRRHNDELLAEGVAGPALMAALASEARAYLLHHPAYVLKQILRGSMLLCSPDATLGWSRSAALRVAAILLIHLPLAAGFLVGMVRSLSEKNAAMAILSIFTVAFLLIHAPVAVSGGRYAVPVLPLMISIAGYGLWGGKRPGPAGPETVRSPG